MSLFCRLPCNNSTHLSIVRLIKKLQKRLLLYSAFALFFLTSSTSICIYKNEPAASACLSISAMAAASSSPLLPDLQQTPAGGSAWQSSGSIGPFFAVISVLTLLSIMSCFLGSICSRRYEEAPPQSRNCMGFLKRRLQLQRRLKDVEVGVKEMELGDRKFDKDGELQHSSS